MEFGVLGPLEVRHGRRIVPLRGPKQKALLAMLLLDANHVVSADRLIDALWGSEPPGSGTTALQVRVSQLRRALEVEGLESPIVTRGPGYMIAVEPDQLDLSRFENIADRGREALAQGNFAAASEELREALSLWRGSALADFAYEDFARVAIMRLEELRLGVLGFRIDADLALGRHRQLVSELQGLVETHPLNERFRAQLMRALYRSGRQFDALDVYRDARERFVEELGIEPSPALRELELAILRHEASLEAPGIRAETAWEGEEGSRERSVLLVPSGEPALAALLALAEPLARTPPRELILMQPVGNREELAATLTRLHERRAELVEQGLAARAAAFVSADPARDVARLAAEQPVDLLLADAPPTLGATGALPHGLRPLLEESLCDVGLLFSRSRDVTLGEGHPVVAPFGGALDDWAAVELAAWIAKTHEAPLQLVGVGTEDPSRPGKDASRLLARASLIVQKTTGIPAEAVLADRGVDALVGAVAGAGLVVASLSNRGVRDELGTVRLGLVRHAAAPLLLVKKGLRPGGLAPKETVTRFTWSMTTAR